MPMSERAAHALQTPSGSALTRLCLRLEGAVQGVGFRPFVYRLATELALTGWVSNDTHGLVAEVEGDTGQLHIFLDRLQREHPANALIQRIDKAFVGPVGYGSFSIRPSEDGGRKTALVLPDLAACAQCV